MRRAVIDIDGVIANPSARFAKAEEAKQRTLSTGASAREATTIYWNTAFTPELVALDTLIPGTDQAIHRLGEMGWFIILLTSRPEAMEKATEAWLAQYELDAYPLVMKPASKQFTKTMLWKADEVLQRAADPDDVVLFVDDEESNRAAVEALGLKNVRCKSSLDEYKPDDSKK